MPNEHEELRQPWRSSRRNLLAVGTAAGIAGFLGTHPASAASSQDKPQTAPEANVRNFGARGNAADDDTAAFQRALDSVHAWPAVRCMRRPGVTCFAESSVSRKV
jgi:hypothetical protein